VSLGEVSGTVHMCYVVCIFVGHYKTTKMVFPLQ